MTSNLPALSAGTLTLLTTYLLHSTLLLGGVWLLSTVQRIRSHALSERLWKFAAVLPLVTAPVQLLTGFPAPSLQLKFERLLPDGDSSGPAFDATNENNVDVRSAT